MNGYSLTIGSIAPTFSNLRGVDGRKYSLRDFEASRVLVVVFSCNHCPHVQAHEERMIAFQRDYASRGVQLIAINSNDIANYPEDSFEAMIQRAKTKSFNFPYLRDEDQSVAEAFGASHTPEFFVFDGNGERRLRYHGKMDDNPHNPAAVARRYMHEAVEAILMGKPVADQETQSIGCTIKWKT